MTTFKDKTFLNNSFIYMIGTMLNQGVNFFTLTIVFANILSPEDYAFIALYGLWVNICLAFISLQSSSSVNNALVEYGDDRLNSFVFSISLLSVVVSVVTLVIVFIFNNAIVGFVGFPTFIIVLIVLQAAVSSFASLQMEKNRVRKRAVSAVFWNSSIPVLRLGFSVFLVIYVFNYNYIGDIYGFFVAALIIGIAAFSKTIYDSKLKFDFSYIKFCLPITVPIIFHGVSNLVLTGTDKYMLLMMIGETEMGIYSFIYNVSLIPTAIWFAINGAWGVEYYEKLSNNDEKSIVSLTNIYIKYIFCAYVVVILVLPEVIKLIAPPEFHPGILYAPFIIAGTFFTFLYTICSIHQSYAKKTIFIPIATIISAGVNVGLNFVFIPMFGAFGAAISIIISFCVLFLMHYFFSGLVIKGFPISFLRMAIPAIIVVGLAVFVYFFVDYWFIRLLPATIFGSLALISFVKFIKSGYS